MSDELLRFYNSELQYVRRLGDQFARSHPQIAGHLRFGTEGDYDPYVGRLIEGFAYLNARTRQKLEDEFPEIAASYLDMVLPHYQRPIPSAAIVGMTLDSSLTEQYEGFDIPRGSIVETDPVEGEPCYFRTCYPVTCWPFKISGIELRGVPFEAPDRSLAAQPLGLLKVSLSTFAREVPFSRFSAERLRFFIRLAPPFSYQFYEMIFDDILGVSAAASAKAPGAVALPENAIQYVGYLPGEGLVDYPPQSFPGYRLLSEYFAFPEKFLFFDVDVSRAVSQINDSNVELFFFLKRRWKDLEPQIKPDALAMGCTPVVNLFSKRTEPIRLTHFDASYTIIPDSRRPTAHEVYSIDSVTGVSDAGEKKEFVPFYSFQHGPAGRPTGFWHATRRESQSNQDLERGTEMDISFVDLDFNPHSAGRWTMDIESTCTNRNLPARIPFGGRNPGLQLAGGGPFSLRCHTKPTSPLRPPLGQGLRWRVVSHLALNHLSLVDNEQGAMALRELLNLYDFRGDEVTANTVTGLLNVRSAPMLGRVPGDRSGAMCRGTSITLEFDEEKFSGGNLFLVACVLERFMAMYSNVNSFTQVTAKSNRRQGILHRWPIRAGMHNLV